jgi:hypothetical protein
LGNLWVSLYEILTKKLPATREKKRVQYSKDNFIGEAKMAILDVAVEKSSGFGRMLQRI